MTFTLFPGETKLGSCVPQQGLTAFPSPPHRLWTPESELSYVKGQSMDQSQRASALFLPCDFGLYTCFLLGDDVTFHQVKP